MGFSSLLACLLDQSAALSLTGEAGGVGGVGGVGETEPGLDIGLRSKERSEL